MPYTSTGDIKQQLPFAWMKSPSRVVAIGSGDVAPMKLAEVVVVRPRVGELGFEGEEVAVEIAAVESVPRARIDL